MISERFIGTKYSFNAGPREVFGVPEHEIKEVNCQSLSLIYFEKVHGISLQPEEVLSSNVYTSTGLPVAEDGKNNFQDQTFLSEILKPGHLLCALDKRKFPYEPPFSQLECDENLQKTLHLAPAIGNKDSDVMRAEFPTIRESLPQTDDVYVFHASYKRGRMVNIWPLQDMLDNYWIMAIKDLFPQSKTDKK